MANAKQEVTEKTAPVVSILAVVFLAIGIAVSGVFAFLSSQSSAGYNKALLDAQHASKMSSTKTQDSNALNQVYAEKMEQYNDCTDDGVVYDAYFGLYFRCSAEEEQEYFDAANNASAGGLRALTEATEWLTKSEDFKKSAESFALEAEGQTTAAISAAAAAVAGAGVIEFLHLRKRKRS